MAGRQPGYVAPLPLTGGTAEAMAQWIDEGIAQDRDGALTPIMRVNPCGQEVLVAQGYELERPCDLAVSATHWSERVLVVRSPVHAAQQAVGLEKRLVHAEHKLAALSAADPLHVAGPPDMVQALGGMLKKHSIPDQDIHAEEFSGY